MQQSRNHSILELSYPIESWFKIHRVILLAKLASFRSFLQLPPDPSARRIAGSQAYGSSKPRPVLTDVPSNSPKLCAHYFSHSRMCGNHNRVSAPKCEMPREIHQTQTTPTPSSPTLLLYANQAVGPPLTSAEDKTSCVPTQYTHSNERS